MKKTKIIYWVFTVLLLALMLPGAVFDIINNKEVVDFMEGHLKYPHYFAPFIGMLKVLGCIALLVPGFPKIKEWVYAGFVFDLVGAMYSCIASAEPAGSIAFLIAGLVIVFGSYIYHHKLLKEKAQ